MIDRGIADMIIVGLIGATAIWGGPRMMGMAQFWLGAGYPRIARCTSVLAWTSLLPGPVVGIMFIFHVFPFDRAGQ